MAYERMHLEPNDRLVRLIVDGAPVEGYFGESVAAALMAAGLVSLRRSVRAGAPRAPFCLMGVCQECVCVIDGAPVEACRMAVREGLIVETGR